MRDTQWVAVTTSAQRRLLMATAVGIIALMLGSIAAFLWHEHQLALDQTGDRAMRRAQRMAQDLGQTLTVARAVIAQVEAQRPASPASAIRAQAQQQPTAYETLLASLPLPFGLHAMGADGKSISVVGVLGETPIGVQRHQHAFDKALAAEQWTLSKANPAEVANIIPLTWKVPPQGQGTEAYGVDLSLTAVCNWLERDRMESDDRASLFWMNADGSATLMARAPHVAADVGRQVRAPWVAAAQKTQAGMLDQLSAIDGLPRRVAFQRLNGPASAMVLVYGAGARMALTPWRANLPYFMGLAFLLTAAMLYGAWRLDRSLRALTQSQRHFQLVLDSGNVWDWDIGEGSVRYAPSFLTELGYTPVPGQTMADTFFKALLPDDLAGLMAALESHLKERKPYTHVFRLQDAQGRTRWFDTKGQAFWDARGRAQYMAGTAFEITERIALEAVQRQTLQRLDTVANASSVLFWTSDLNGDVDWTNHRSQTFTGRTTAQLQGQGWMQLVHPDDVKRRPAWGDTPTTGHEATAIEYRLRNQAGEFRWVVEQCLPLRDADQRTTGFLGSCVDITELRQAEHAARQRGAMLEAMFNVMQDLLFVLDQDGRFLYFQGSADERLLSPPDVFLGKFVQDVMPAAITALMNQKMAQAQAGELQDFDYVLALPDGEHHFEARMAWLPDSNQYMVVARDITDREALRHQRERLQQFMALQAQLATNFINLPIADIDQGIDSALAEIGAFAHADRAYVFEYDELRQQTSNTHEWCAPQVKAELGNLQNIDLALIPEWVQAHGQHQMVSIPDIPAMPAGPLRDILDAQGIRSLITLPMNTLEKCIGFVGFDVIDPHQTFGDEQIDLLRTFAQMLVNVYGRKAADASLRQLADELEQRVLERTAQLDVSVRRLSQANRELESFAYSVSHDLKAPLRSVEGFASLLLEEHSAALNAEARDYLGRIQAASLHMARLISDLLAYCRMEELDKKIAPVPLLDVFNEVIGGMRNELDACHAQVHLNVPADVTALANPQGLAMVLRNLLDNAIKFSRPGCAPEISLTAQTTGPFTRLCIKDEGLGFDMRYHERIFALFQRLHRRDAIDGTGIGLAMVHKAVQRMNGRIWAESKPGEGAKFHIELPRA